MKFLVLQCSDAPQRFVVTDEAHRSQIDTALCGGGGLIEIGSFDEMGKERVAFDETLARNSIEAQGYYVFEAASMEPVPTAPDMPG